MRERKYIKFRTDMFEDTKSKIIDRMPKRDLIHYIWSRFVLLAGKVNKEGELYMSRNIPYTIETLSIEFNRDIDEIKTALDVLIELEMIELTEDKVYMVKNFAKHQNIKTKEKIETKNKEKDKEKDVIDKGNNVNNIKNKEIKNEVQSEKLEEKARSRKNGNSDTKLSKSDVMPLADYIEANLEPVDKSDESKENEKTSSQHNNQSVILEMKKSQNTNRKNKKANKKKIKDDITEIENTNPIENMEEEKDEDLCCWITEEQMVLKDGERVVSEWGF